jgi:hypothetical protein
VNNYARRGKDEISSVILGSLVKRTYTGTGRFLTYDSDYTIGFE